MVAEHSTVEINPAAVVDTLENQSGVHRVRIPVKLESARIPGYALEILEVPEHPLIA